MNKTIVISGATGALGTKTAQAFAARGDSLVLLDNDQTKLDALVHALHLPADLFARVAEVDRALERGVNETVELRG